MADDSETLTATDVEPTPAEPEPKTEAAPGPAPAEPAPEAPALPPWASVQGTDWEDLLDHEEFAPVLAKREERIKSTLHQELGTQYKRDLEAVTANWAGTQMAQTVAGYYGSIAQKIETGDYEGAEKLLDKLDIVAQPYLRLAEGVNKVQGGRELANTVIEHLKAELSTHKDRDAFEDILKGPAGQSWPETIKAWKKLASEGAITAERKNIEKLAREQAQAELAARKREDKGRAPGVPAGGGGGEGRSDKEILLDPATPIEKLMEIRARQRAQG